MKITMVETEFQNDTMVSTKEEIISKEVYENYKKSIKIMESLGGKEYPEYNSKRQLKRLTSVSPNGYYRIIRTFKIN